MIYEGDNKYTVYAHINTANNKMYIGITGSKPEKRWSNGKAYKYNSYFTRAINKYAWDNFQHEIIAEHLTEHEAKNFEILLIEKLNLTNRDLGYNLTKGGESSNGLIHSEESKEKIRIKNSGKNNFFYGKHHTEESNQKNREAHLGEKSVWYGKHHTEEEKRKIGEGNKGKIVSDETRKKSSISHMGKSVGTENFNSKKVICIDTGIVYDFIRKATKELNLDKSGISACLHGLQKTCGKLADGTRLHWMLYSEYEKLNNI